MVWLLLSIFIFAVLPLHYHCLSVDTSVTDTSRNGSSAKARQDSQYGNQVSVGNLTRTKNDRL